MSLKEQLNADLKAAMKAGDDVRKTVLRQLLAGVRQAELDKRAATVREIGRGAELTAEQLDKLDQLSLDDTEITVAIQKEAKSRRESIADAEQAGRDDLAKANQAELAIIEGYLPRQMSREEIAALARQAIAETGATDAKQAGAVMKVLAPRTRGQADGRLVNEVVRELLGQ